MQAAGPLLEVLQTTAWAPFGVPISWGELLGDVTGALCVFLLARQNLWTWPLGLANNALFFALFWEAKLYADATLQIAFFALGVLGWWRWVHPGRARPELPVRRTRPREWAGLAAATAGATAAVAWLLTARTDSPVPLADAAVMTLSLAATYGQTQKLLESWWVWIAVDLLSVPLYVSRGLYPTAVLYAVFLCLCISGLLAWRSRLP